jgi:hypothetical protein
MMKEEEIKSGVYLTIPQIAYDMKISESTLRRYIKNFSDFFYVHIHEGCEYYKADETMERLRVIRENSKVGKNSRERVLIALNEQFKPYEKNEFLDYEKRMRTGIGKITQGLEEVCVILKEIAERRGR